MNSYGDPNSAHGRAYRSGAGGGYGSEPDDRQWDAGGDDAAAGPSYSGYGDPELGWSRGNAPTGSGRGGRASVGGGRASVGGVAPVSGSASVGGSSGRASAGRASVGGSAGRASVGGSAGRASVGGVAPVSGSASVGGGAAGRATVGRASVRPVSPAGGFGGGPGGFGDGPGGPGGPGGPDGPTGPGRRGRGGRNDPAAAKKAKRRRRINLLIASFAILIMLTGGAVVGGTYYTTTVALPEELPLPLASTIYASDGSTRIAKLGEFNRIFVPVDQIPEHVQEAVASAEDRKFYDHSGIDYVGIARAAWNNFTGGSRQGASTITQQYAKNAMDLREVSYARKVREAVLASKLNDRYEKHEIMGFYLNTIYFGRGAYGIEAAAQQYFGKSVADLTIAEGAVIAAVIKQPEPDASHPGFDPAVDEAEAKARWEYVISGMVEKGWISPEERPTEYPEVKAVDPNSCIIDCGINTPEGNVINYVREEMVQLGICAPDTCSQALRQGGYKITTTIDPRMQEAAKKAIWRQAEGSAMEGQPENLMAAMVAIDPATGRVLAYFGGDNGTGHDYAGRNYENGQWTGGHSPGSTFKIYTLAAALDNDISIDSHWNSKPFKVEGTEIQVQNAGRNASCGEWCSLVESTVQSYNVPFYHVTEQIGADKVVGMAKAAGISTMWNTADDKPYDLTTVDPKEVAPSPFFNVVAYGQYPVTVLDHANGVATLANRGIYNKAHFVVSVEQKNTVTGEWLNVGGEQLKPEQRIRQEVVADLTDVLTRIPDNINKDLSGGRPVAGKTGTWELNDSSSENGDAWMVGYTPQIAAAVWVGNVADRKPLRDKANNKIGGAGLPATIWQRFMNEAHKGMDVARFPAARNIGSVDAGNGKSPAPPPPDPDRQGGGGICDGPLGAILCPNGTPPAGNGNNPGNNDPGNGSPPTNGDGTDPNNGGQNNGGDAGNGIEFGGGRGGGGVTLPPTVSPTGTG